MDNNGYIYIYIINVFPSGGTKLMLLESLTKHPSQSTADHISRSISYGRCGDGQLSPAFKSIWLNAFGGWKFDWGTTKLHARILWGEGAQKKMKPNIFTARSSTSATFVLPVNIYIYLYMYTYIYIYTHTWIYIYIFTYTHICIYTQRNVYVCIWIF